MNTAGFRTRPGAAIKPIGTAPPSTVRTPGRYFASCTLVCSAYILPGKTINLRPTRRRRAGDDRRHSQGACR